MFRAGLKLIATIFLIVTYAAAALMIRLAVREHCRQRRVLARLTSFYTRLCVKVFGIRIDVEGAVNAKAEGQAPLILANHLSYLDVIALSAVYSAVFVTSVEVRDTPFLGFMAKSGGSIFVERRSKWGLSDELRQISEVLKSGVPVVVFPEGTSSNGDGVLPFKSALLSSAESSETRILPVCIRYTELDGAPVTARNRDRLYYYGDIDFFPHFLGLMAIRSFGMRIRFLSFVNPQEISGDEITGSRRRSLANQIRQRIVEAYSGGVYV